MDRSPGEYSIASIIVETFDRFVTEHTDYKYKLQFAKNRVVLSIMYPLHEGAANIIIQEILYEIQRMCAPAGPKVTTRTGRINSL
jgi:hypothetical protein